MRIGLVTPYFPDSKTINSGIANHFLTLSEALSDLENNVVIVHVRSRYADEIDSFDKRKINTNTILLTYKAALPKWVSARFKHKWALLDFLLKLKCIIIATTHLSNIQKEYKLDVIETSSYFSLCYFYLFTRPKVPVVTRVSTTFLQMMNNYYPFKSRLFRIIGSLEILMLKKSKCLITHANTHALELAELYKIDRKKFHIIPHGISLPKANNFASERNSPLKILYVGRLEYRKGTDVLLEAIPIIINKYKSVNFELIGSDPNGMYETNFRKENNEEINKTVTFSGCLDNISTQQAYANCDLFIAPSRYESFGLIYIEAMSYGKPVIGCKVGGVPEIIEDNVNGLFAEPGNPSSLAEKIAYLIDNSTIMKTMGVNAKKKVDSRFSKEILALNSISYYKMAQKAIRV